MPTVRTPRRRILDAASELFLQDGYRVSMDAVAKRADVSKQTVYSHFSNKDALFRAAIKELVTPLHTPLDARNDSIESSLQAMAVQYNRYICSPSTTALGRMLIAEAPRFPRAARELYQSGSGTVLERLSERIRQSMQTGELRHDDPRQAAEIFLSMLDGMNPQRTLLGLRRRGRKAQDTWASNAIEIFLRAYQTHSPSTDQTSRKSP